MEGDRKRNRPAEDRDEKRTRRTAVDARKPRRGADEVIAVDDVEDEVEQFFAIVRRMHSATRQSSAGCPSRVGRMSAANGGQVSVEDEEEERKGRFHRWRPAFEWEDFQTNRHPATVDGGQGKRSEAASATSAPVAAVGGAGKKEDKAAEGRIAVRLDLNAEPEPERVLG